MPNVVSQGVTNLRTNGSLWYGLYLAKVGLAAIIAVPLLVVVNQTLESSAFANALLSDWSMDVILELSYAKENVFTTFLIVLAFYTIAVFVLRQFLNGGIYSALLSRRRQTLDSFFGQGAVQFAGHVRVSLFMALVYILLIVFATTAGSLVPTDQFRHFGPAALNPAIARFALLYPFLILGTIFSDLLRFSLAAHPHLPFKVHLTSAMDTYRSQFVKLIGVYYLYFIPMVLIWLAVEVLAAEVTRSLNSMFGVLVELVLFQVCSFLRTGQSLAGTATIACLLPESTVEPSVQQVAP